MRRLADKMFFQGHIDFQLKTDVNASTFYNNINDLVKFYNFKIYKKFKWQRNT